MACLLICAWFFVFANMIRAVILGEILWPQKQEDRDEGGWKMDADQKRAHDAGEETWESTQNQATVEREAQLSPTLERRMQWDSGTNTLQKETGGPQRRSNSSV